MLTKPYPLHKFLYAQLPCAYSHYLFVHYSHRPIDASKNKPTSILIGKLNIGPMEYGNDTSTLICICHGKNDLLMSNTMVL
jgi:hypothetical protein